MIDFIKENALVLSASAVAVAGFWRQLLALITGLRGLFIRRLELDGVYHQRELYLFVAATYRPLNKTRLSLRFFTDTRGDVELPVVVPTLPNSQESSLRRGEAGWMVCRSKNICLEIDYLAGAFDPDLFLKGYDMWLRRRNTKTSKADRFSVSQLRASPGIGVGGVRRAVGGNSEQPARQDRSVDEGSCITAYFGGPVDSLVCPVRVWELAYGSQTETAPCRKFGAFDTYIPSPASEQARDLMTSWLHRRDWYQARNIRWKRGILLDGPPGTGKTQLAVALAKEAMFPLVIVALGDFADKPAQLREAWLKLVSQDAPLFIALDEIEKVNDGEVGKALLPVLLECIDGAQTKDGVFLVALSNAASALPPALMRRGRIDKVLHMDLPTPACREAYLRSILGDRYSADLPDKTQGMNYPDMLNLCLDILDEHGTKTT